MLSTIKSISVYGGDNGIVSFNINGMDPQLVASILDTRGICTRAGLHCAPLAHRTCGTLESGTVRISLSCMNTVNEIEKAYEAILDIANSS